MNRDGEVRIVNSKEEKVEKIEDAYALFKDGKSYQEIADAIGTSKSTVYYWSKNNNWAARLKLETKKKIETVSSEEYQAVTIEQERARADERHRLTVKRLQLAFTNEHVSQAFSKEDEIRKINRLKALKITTEGMLMLIDKEREILGISSNHNDQERQFIPETYQFQIVGGVNTDGLSSIPIKTINVENIKESLDNQNPFVYGDSNVVVKNKQDLSGEDSHIPSKPVENGAPVKPIFIVPSNEPDLQSHPIPYKPTYLNVAPE